MDERRLLSAAFHDREAWATIAKHTSIADFSPEGSALFRLFSDFYGLDPVCSKCDLDILVERAIRETASNKLGERIVGALKELCASATDISAINVAKEVIDLKAHGLGLKIASQLASGKPSKETVKWMKDYVELGSSLTATDTSDTQEQEHIGVLASDLVKKHFTKDSLIKLWPKSLNDHVDGGVRGGHHILIFAPTEMGKSLVAINMCAGFLKQGLRVLYVGNEDPAADIIMRMMCRLTGMNKYEIQENPDKCDSILASRNWQNFVFADLFPGTFEQVEKLVEKHQAQVVILDQLRNIDVDSENRTQALEKAATAARTLAKSRNVPVISITQAGDSATGKTILGRGDVDGSNVGIPGQCDLMIGVGANSEMEGMNMRVFSFAKNKLSGRHTPLHVTVDPTLSKVIDNVSGVS